jgi:hypothetical protein
LGAASVIARATLYDTASGAADNPCCDASSIFCDLAHIRGTGRDGTPMLSESIGLQSSLPLDQRVALEQLLFFNSNQHRVRVGIQQSIETYGVPEIHEHDGGLSVRVGDIGGVQTIFAVSETGRPIGVAVFVRLASDRFVVLHLGVQPRTAATAEMNTRVLLKLMHGIRSAARGTRGVERIELVYKNRHAVRLHV